MTAFTAYSADMNRAPAPVTSIEEMSLNRLWAAPKLPRLSFNHLAVSGCTSAVPSDQLGRWRAGRQLDRHALPDGRARGHRAHAGPRFASPVTETTPLAPSTADAAAATERLAA